jgi:hypothetical protein
MNERPRDDGDEMADRILGAWDEYRSVLLGRLVAERYNRSTSRPLPVQPTVTASDGARGDQ